MGIGHKKVSVEPFWRTRTVAVNDDPKRVGAVLPFVPGTTALVSSVTGSMKPYGAQKVTYQRPPSCTFVVEPYTSTERGPSTFSIAACTVPELAENEICEVTRLPMVMANVPVTGVEGQTVRLDRMEPALLVSEENEMICGWIVGQVTVVGQL